MMLLWIPAAPAGSKAHDDESPLILFDFQE